jgi:hypothetical protein
LLPHSHPRGKESFRRRVLPPLRCLPKEFCERRSRIHRPSNRVRTLLKERPELTQSEIAKEIGVSQPMVSKIITNSLLAQKRLYLPVPPMIRLTLDPARVAAKIFQKMGEQYAF